MTITIEHQKEVSFKVLKALKFIDNDAIIAGGAPRNWDEGKLANDVDCYLRWNVSRTTSAITAIERLLCDEVSHEASTDCSYSFGGDSFHLRKLISFRYEDVLFQLVIIEEEKKLNNFTQAILNHMDIGLNMIACDWWGVPDIGHYVKTEYYQTDRDNQTLTLYQDTMQPDQLKHCMDKHLPKMISYYPNYKLNIGNMAERQ